MPLETLWYLPDELAEIEDSIAPNKIDSRVKQLLQEALARYQVEYLKDDPFMRDNFPALTNKGRRRQLELIIKLCEEVAPSSEVEKALGKLGKDNRQLLWPAARIDHEKLKVCTELAIAKTGKRGPTPKQSRLPFIRDLARLFIQITDRIPGRSVPLAYPEQGCFLRFVKAALEPFNASQGCEADIKIVLAEVKRARSEAAK
jgi:hypothetical protein